MARLWNHKSPGQSFQADGTWGKAWQGLRKGFERSMGALWVRRRFTKGLGKRLSELHTKLIDVQNYARQADMHNERAVADVQASLGQLHTLWQGTIATYQAYRKQIVKSMDAQPENSPLLTLLDTADTLFQRVKAEVRNIDKWLADRASALL